MGRTGDERTISYRASRAWLGVGLLLILLAILPAAARGALSSVPDNNWVTNGPVYAMARSGSTMYLGGSFTEVGPRTGPAVTFSGGSSTPDASFPQVSGGRAEVRAAISDGAGGWYLGGSFTHVGGVARAGLAHIEAGSSVDPNFAPTLEMARGGAVEALALSGSTLYVGGFFSELDGQPRKGLAALNTSDGSLQSFNPASTGAVGVDTLAVSGGTLYVGGSFSEMGGQARSDLAAFTVSTGALTGWAPPVAGASAMIRALAVSGSTVYLAGSFDHIGGQARSGFAAVDTSGALASWNPESSGCANVGYALAVTGTAVYVGGCFTHIGGQPRIGAAALDLVTASATSWNPEAGPGTSAVTTVAVAGSTVYVGGTFTSAGGQVRNGLAALDATTAKATSWNPDPNITSGLLLSQPVDVVAAAGSQVLAGGGFTSVGGVARKDLAAIDLTTGEAAAWNPDVSPAFPLMTVPIDAISVAGGLVYVGGSFSQVGGQPRTDLAALDPTTGTATSWNPGATSAFPENGHVSALLATVSTVYAAGSFTTLAGRAQRYLGAIDATSGAATSWSPVVSAPSAATEHGAAPIAALALSGTNLYVGGDFSELDGQIRSGTGALNTESAGTTAWTPALKSPFPGEQPDVSGLSVAGSTVYLAAGEIGLVAVDATSGAALPWHPPAGLGQVGVVASAHGSVYLGGIGLDAASGLPLSWNPGLGGVSIVLAGSDHVYLAGYFGTTEDAAASGFAAFTITGPINTTAPTITGTAAESKTLSEHHGSWTGSPTSYAYQWVRCPQGTPPHPCTPIAGATGPSYTPTGTDAGSTIIVQETATDAQGTSDPVGSVATAPVLARPANTIQPIVTGTPSVGQMLNCSTGTWSNSPTAYTYAWLRDFEPIPGATGSSYLVTSSDVGHDISCEVIATNAAGSTSALADAGTIEAGGGGGSGEGGGQTGGGSSGSAGSGNSSSSTSGGSTAAVSNGGAAQTSQTGPSPSAVAAALTALLSTKTPPPTITGVLHTGGFSLTFTAPGAGILSIRWMTAGGRTARQAKSVIIASGSRSFSAAGRGLVKLRLTAAGRKLLKKSKILRVVERVSFTPSGGSVQTRQVMLVMRPGKAQHR